VLLLSPELYLHLSLDLLDSLVVLLWFELPVFDLEITLEIIDLVFHPRHFVLHLLHLERQLTRPILKLIAIGLVI
jgi:hypothetical protein